MAKNDTLFGEVRSLLQQTPSAEVWAELVKQLDKFTIDAQFTEEIFPYLLEYLGRWPEDVRRMAPAKWVKPLLKKAAKPAPLVPLCNGADLSSSRIGPATAAYLADCAALGHLLYLDLSNNGLKSDGAKHLARSKHLRNLRVLLLTNCKVGNSGAVALAESVNVQHLVELDISGSDMIDDGCDALQNSRFLPEPLRAKAYEWYSHEREEREYYRDGWE